MAAEALTDSMNKHREEKTQGNRRKPSEKKREKKQPDNVRRYDGFS